MNHTNGRLILKVKKRRNSFPVSNKIIETEKENINARIQRGQKRTNPFSKNEVPLDKVVKLCNTEHKIDEENVNESNFLSGLQKYEICPKKSTTEFQDACTKFLKQHDVVQESNCTKKDAKQPDTEPQVTYKHETLIFPLDWSIKHRIRFFSKKPFSFGNIKPTEECKGIHQFTSKSMDETSICQSLYNWIHPSIPGVPNFPLKTKVTGGILSEDKIINLLSNNKPLQENVMKQWRNSFQSLFSMLRNDYCPYFYMCTYQFTVVFKAAGLGSKSISAVIGPTTKGLRDLLTEEGISFEFIYNMESKKSNKEIEFGFEEEESEKVPHENHAPSLNTSYEEDFLDSIGLNKKEHFPSIESQQRLTIKSKLRSIDNRIESTLKIKNCQGLFNFLLNANFLCSPSGIMAGVPPTLISPSPFEGGTLCKCKMSNGPIKQQKKSSAQTVYCIDVNGVFIPSQAKGLVDFLTKDRNDDDDVLRIQTKTFDMLNCLNGTTDNSQKDSEGFEKSLSKHKMSPEMKCFLSQQPVSLSDNTDIVFNNSVFKF